MPVSFAREVFVAQPLLLRWTSMCPSAALPTLGTNTDQKRMTIREEFINESPAERVRGSVV